MFSFFNSILLALLPLSVTFLLLFVVIPLKKIHSYKRNGTETYFFPILGIFQYWENIFKQTGDMMANSKESTKLFHNSKFMLSNLRGKLVIVLRDPQYIKEFFLKPHLYNKNDDIEPLRYLLGNGLVTSEGDIWKRHRKLISNSFNYEFLKTNTGVIQNTAREFLGKLAPNDYTNYPVISKIQEITGEIVGRIFFGENLNIYTFEEKPLTLALADIASELSLVSMTPLVALLGANILNVPFILKYRRIISRVKGVRSICTKIINDRKNCLQQDKKPNDLLASLLATQKSEDSEKRFTDEEIIDEFVTFFVAGMDTTGHLIAMALYNLTQHPEYLQELKEERDLTYNTEPSITADTLQKMDKLHSFLKETLRFYSPAPLVFLRKALVDHKICDLEIKKGDILVPELLAPAFDEKNFEEPHKFNPARWRDTTVKADPYAFVPFSAGSRNCIGQHLAMMEAKVIMSEFLERYRFELKDGYELRMTFKFLYEPENELLFNLTSQSV